MVNLKGTQHCTKLFLAAPAAWQPNAINSLKVRYAGRQTKSMA